MTIDKSTIGNQLKELYTLALPGSFLDNIESLYIRPKENRLTEAATFCRDLRRELGVSYG